MKAKNISTCERPTTANQCVMIVLHSPGPLVLGEERKVTTDYWRGWSNAKGSYAFHQAMVKKIAMHYKELIPSLQWLKIKSDGCRLCVNLRKIVCVCVFSVVCCLALQVTIQRALQFLASWARALRDERNLPMARFSSIPPLCWASR